MEGEGKRQCARAQKRARTRWFRPEGTVTVLRTGVAVTARIMARSVSGSGVVLVGGGVEERESVATAVDAA